MCGQVFLSSKKAQGTIGVYEFMKHRRMRSGTQGRNTKPDSHDEKTPKANRAEVAVVDFKRLVGPSQISALGIGSSLRPAHAARIQKWEDVVRRDLSELFAPEGVCGLPTGRANCAAKRVSLGGGKVWVYLRQEIERDHYSHTQNSLKRREHRKHNVGYYIRQ